MLNDSLFVPVSSVMSLSKEERPNIGGKRPREIYRNLPG